MTISIKVAQSASELHQAFHLRFEVYQADGHYNDAPNQLVMDKFDAMHSVATIIAYDDDIPVGTLRVNRDSPAGLPADEAFDFGEYRQKINDEAEQNGEQKPLFVSSGMLAIAEKWRNRRNVFRALFKVGCDVAHSWGATHIIATVNQSTVAIYRRLGFDILAQKQWHEIAQDHIAAVACPLSKLYDWAFAPLTEQKELMERFSGCFEYRLISVGDTVFEEGEPGDEAYLINSGMVNIYRTDRDSHEKLKLATLGPGEMFGDMTLIDDGVRSAQVVASANTELLVLDRSTFWQKAEQDPIYLKSLLNSLSNRLRETDKRTLVYAYGDTKRRLSFFLERIYQEASPSLKTPENRIAKLTVAEYAFTASVEVADAEKFLTALEQTGCLTWGNKGITFKGELRL